MNEKMWHKIDSIKQLNRGDIIVNINGNKSYVVNCVYGDRATATDSVDITNPDEWMVLNVKNTQS